MRWLVVPPGAAYRCSFFLFLVEVVMEMFDGEAVAVPMVRIVFEDLKEFVQLENLASRLGMGKDWPIAMLRDYLGSYQESAHVPLRVVDLPLCMKGKAGNCL